MSQAIFTGLLNNVTLLLALGVLYNILPTRQRKLSLRTELFTGLVIGAIGAAVMLTPLTFAPGLIFDTRSIVLSLSGLFFGAIPTALAVLVTAALRYFQGGIGALHGIGMIFTTAAIGLGWRYLRRRWLAENYSWLELYLFGAAAHLTMLIWMAALPAPTGLAVIRSLGVPIAALFPLGTALMGRLLAYQQSRQDAQERARKAEAGLRASEERYRLLVDHAADGIFITNPDTSITQINSNGCAILGYSQEELLSMRFEDLVVKESVAVDPVSHKELRSGKPVLRERQLRRKGGAEVAVEINAVMLPDGNLQGIMRDITERKKLEASFLSAQKMASLGTLAAGVAHEINSPLQVITGLSDRHLRELSKNNLDANLLEKDFSTLKRNAWRIAEIVRSLLTYARPSLNKMTPGDLTDIIEDTLLLIEHKLRSWQSITIQKDLDDAVPPLVCDRNSLTQVLINLLTNAADAMPEGGDITIHTHHQPATKHVILQISDTGVGIPEATLQKVFDPFYTTKDIGHGTGLGLSIVRGIVEAHGGTIAAASIPDQGSLFSITLPLAGPAAHPVSADPSNERFA
jgi:PAS domain S-box-containing protein